MSSTIERRLSTCLLLATIGCAICLSAPRAAARQTTASSTLAISGRAVDEDGRPLGGIVARLFPAVDSYRRARIELGLEEPSPPLTSSASDAKGFFRVAAPDAGVYVLELADPEPSSGDRFERRALLAVEDVDFGTVRLRRARAIEVVVRSAEGAPLAGARVGSNEGWNSGLAPAASRGRSDDRGRVTILIPDSERRGPVDVLVTAPGYAVAKRTTRTDRLEVTLEKGHPHRLRVLDADSKPSARTVLQVGEFAIDETAPDGTIELRAERGSLELGLLSADLATARATLRNSAQSEPTRVSARPDVASPPIAAPQKPEAPRTEVLEHIVRLAAATLVEGTVVEKEGGQPIPGAFVATVDRDQLARSDAKGAFALRLPPRPSGTTRLEARHSEHAPAFWFMPPDGRSQRLAARLEMERARRIAGTVVDSVGRPVVGAEVTMDRGGADRGREGARTDEAGRFHLVLPLLGGSPRLEVRHPELATLRREITASELEAGVVRFVLDAGRIAVGWVADSQARPIEGARVDLAAFGSPNQPPWLQPAVDDHAGTDAEGRFAFPRIAPGRYLIRVTREGFAPAAVPGVEVSAGEGEVELGTITLGPGATIEGVVLTPEREPLEGVELWLGGRQTPSESATSDADGRFAMRDLAPGTDEMLRASLEGWVAFQREVAVRQDAQPIEIVMQPGLRLAGVVVDGTTESEIADARVSLQPNDRSSRFELPGAFQRARSAVDGTFELDELPAGTYRLSVQAAEYQPATVEGLELRAGEQREPLRVVLRAGVVVTGRVLDAEGEPLAEARVERREEQRRGLGMSFGIRGTPVDAEGRYRLDGLPAEPVVLVAHAPERSSLIRELVLEPGDNEVDFVLEPSPVLAGRVVDQQGQPVGGAQVWQRSGNSGTGAESDASGRFRIPVELGAVVRVQASKPGAGSSAVLEIEVPAASLPEVELQLRPGTTLRGRVEGLDVDELARTSVRAIQSALPSRGGVSVRPDFEGRFQLDDLQPGRWTVLAQSAGRTEQELVVVEADVAELEVILRFEEGATLSGTVVSAGEPVAEARLYASGLDVDGQANTRTDAAGAFRLEGLAPGRYSIQVDARGRSSSHNQDVEVRGDEQITIELPGFEVAGRVLSGEDGPPLTGAQVVLMPLRRSEQSLWRGRAQLTTNGEGHFRAIGLAEGTYTYEASHPEHATRTGEVEARDGSSQELTIALERSAGLILHVTGPLGIPAARVGISVRAPDGRTLLSRSYAAGEDGRIAARDLPLGRQSLVVSDGNALAELEAEVPGDEVEVQLVRGGFLEVSAPELAEQGGVYPVEVERAAGATRVWSDALPLRRGFARIGPLPAGSWIVRVRSDDRELAATAVVEPGGTVAVELQ